MKKKVLACMAALLLAVPVMSLTACSGTKEIKFHYDKVDYQPDYGEGRTNAETYDSVKVSSVAHLREDFMMGVDASMVKTVEEKGGVYYNLEGKEQDVFQILADSGVNFFRVRVWNDPKDRYGEGYGGGNVGTAEAVAMAKRAKAVGMNVLVDLHYSDFWADPETQEIPKAWASKTASELVNVVKDYTKETMQAFQTAGVRVDMIQIGNEINNGMLGKNGAINWNDEKASFKQLSDYLKAGISGAQSVFKDIYTAIHLANGGNYDEFDTFFGYLKENGVNYDAIGASYYPYYHGSYSDLQSNLDRISEKYDKYVFVAEFSYGFTTQETQYAANTYNATYEDAGAYLTSVQGQATALRDVIDVVAKVPNQKGLGVFYWEPAWLPVEGAGWASAVSGRNIDDNGVATDGLATWSNQGLFSYTGKALPSLQTFSLVKGTQGVVNETGKKLRRSQVDYTINIREDETLPETVAVETNLDAIRQKKVVWDTAITEKGNYTIKGTVEGVSAQVTAEVAAIENFVRDPGYEKQGATDSVIDPWTIVSQTPEGDKVVKLDRKTDTRTGKTDLNWYHSSKEFSFNVAQTITLSAGTYELSVYSMATTNHTVLEMYVSGYGGEELKFSLLGIVDGWGSADQHYKRATLTFTVTESKTITVGFRGAGPAAAWGHLDDWALVKI